MPRVYVPASLELLATWYAEGLVPGSAERFVAPDDTEEGEHAALTAAAGASAALLLGNRGRRVVVVGVPPGEDDDIPWRLLAAVHADAGEVALGAGEPGELGELAWFGVQEVPGLLAR